MDRMEESVAFFVCWSLELGEKSEDTSFFASWIFEECEDVNVTLNGNLSFYRAVLFVHIGIEYR
jgi:hypothetical protein